MRIRLFFKSLIVFFFLSEATYTISRAQLAGYGYKQLIIVDHNQVSGTADLINFPMLVDITDLTLRTTGNGGYVTSANGYDIAFTSADGTTVLDHEIDSYDGVNGQIIAWVRIPTLDYDDDTDIYMYYGNGSIGTDPSTTNTWDTNYEGVWHLDESGNGTANEYKDGTSNSNDGQGGSGSSAQTPTLSGTGRFGGAQDFDGSNDYIDVGAINPTSVTVSAWAKREGTSDGWWWQDIVGNQAWASGGFLLFLDLETSRAAWRTHAPFNVTTVRLSPYTTSDWHLYTGTFTGTTVRLYVDGELVSTNTTAGLGVSSRDVAIGDDGVGNNNGFFDGLIDEVRISDIARSDDWIATEYNNQNDPSSFYSLPSPGGVSTDLTLWYNANKGVTGSPTVSSWANQRGISELSSSSGDPQLVSSGINFNNSIDFDGAGDYFQTTATSIIGANNPYTKFAVIITDNSGTGQIMLGAAGQEHDLRVTTGDILSSRHWSGGSTTNWGTSTNSTTAGQAHLAGLRYDGLGGLDDQSMLDGVKSVASNQDRLYDDSGSIEIGSRNSGITPWDGYISEAIVYTGAVADADVVKIESYLAIKYGITLDNTGGGINGDYQASDGSVLWDASINSAYHNDVAGIGKDRNSGLHQLKSKSVNSDAMLIMDHGSEFNNNLNFIMWGNNNGPLTVTTTGAYPKYMEILQRNWKASVTGSPGSVTVRLIYSNTGVEENYGLLVKDDNDFSFGVTSYTASSISGDTITFTNVNLSDGDFLTLGLGIPSPGGVTNNLSIWLKANAGASTTTDGVDISSWGDMSASDNDVNQSAGGLQPTYLDNVTDNINFNPVIEFDGTDDYMLDATGILGTTTYNDLNVYSVIITDDVQNSILFRELCSPTRISVLAPFGDSNYYWDAGGVSGDHRLSEPWGGTEGTPYLWGHLYSTTSSQTVSGARQVIERNGASLDSDNTASSFTGTDSQFNLGGSPYFEGKVAELVAYTGAINATQHNQIESYLAIKYGITLSNSGSGTNGDYTASDGTILWDASANSSYHYDIAGIGRDDASALDQQRSKSINSGVVLDIEKGGSFSSDLDFLMWGNNNASATTTATGANEFYDTRLNRIWKASVAGTPGDVSVVIDFANDGVLNHYGLHVDSDEDFTSGSTTYIASSISGNEITFDNVTINDGDYFTLGVRQISPGGVSTNLVLWMTSGVGVVGSPITDWYDQSGMGNDATQAGTGDFATLSSGILNYNPSVHFPNGDNGYFDVNLDDIKGTDYNVIGVVQRDNSISSNYFMGITGTGTNERFHFGYRDNTTATLAHFSNDVNVSVIAFDNPYESASILRGELDTSSGKSVYELRHGNSSSNFQANTDVLGGTGTGRLGHDYTTRGYEGYLAEAIAYNSTLTSDEVRRINTYLAVKYALTLDNSGGGIEGDYVASDGTTIWDADAESGFQNEVIALGRDDASGLHQKQSHIVHDSLRIYIDALAADNDSNTGSVDNDISFIVIGHNGEKQRAQNVERPVNTIKARFGREWKVTNTNFDDTFTLRIQWDNNNAGGFDINQIRLLVDDDTDFSDATILSSADGLTFANGSIIVGGISTSHIPKNSTRFITIGSVNWGVPLPIELTYFAADATEDGTVALQWETASEINNDFFTIERSKDAEIWREIMTIEGAGNSTEAIQYEAVDKNPYSGYSYYRLKQTDYDGEFTYSEVEVVNMEGTPQSEISLYPNPAQETVTIEGIGVGISPVSIYNVYGQLVSDQIYLTEKQADKVIIDIANLKVGVYTVKSQDEYIKFIKK